MVSHFAKGTTPISHEETDTVIKYVVNDFVGSSLRQEVYFGIYAADGSLVKFHSRHLFMTTEEFQAGIAHAARADQVYPRA